MSDIQILQVLACVVGSCILGVMFNRWCSDGVSDPMDEDSEVYYD